MSTFIGGLMSTILRVMLTILLAMGTPALLFSQATYTAQLTGTVTDSSGGVVAGAKVSLTDEATNIAATAETDDQGVYVFTGLRPGSYMLRVEANNFASVERKNLILAVNQRASLNVTLNPDVVVALSVRAAPFGSQTEVHGQLRILRLSCELAEQTLRERVASVDGLSGVATAGRR